MNKRHLGRIALKALRKNKLQTALTMIGMTIGVATVLTMIALGTGAQIAIQDQVRAAGMNMIVVNSGNYKLKLELPSADNPSGGGETGASTNATYIPENTKAHLQTAVWDPGQKARLMRVQRGSTLALIRPGDLEAGHGAATTLTMDDAAAIRKIRGVQYVASGIHENANLKHGDVTHFTSIHGDDTTMPRIRRAWAFLHGRYYSASEEKKAENVVVLGQIVSEKLFGKTANPVGETIVIRGETFKIIGVIGSSSWMTQPAEGDNQFDAVYVPVTTMQRLLKQDYLSTITVTTQSTGDVLTVSRAITKLLLERHNIDAATPADFTIGSESHKSLLKGMRPEMAMAVVGNSANLDKVTLDQLGKTLDKASATMTALLTSIAAVSLLVGGIGVMNIMLLSVSQRTREIGIRRAVGARAQDVMKQFLFEATALSVIGGSLGILIGCLAADSISRWAQWSTSISAPAIVISFTISAAIGIFFGYYPAREASRIVPIQALTHE